MPHRGSSLKIERTTYGFNINGLKLTVLEAMFIVDWVLDQLEQEAKDDESMPMTQEAANFEMLGQDEKYGSHR
jgi:hypothetical protein